MPSQKKVIRKLVREIRADQVKATSFFDQDGQGLTLEYRGRKTKYTFPSSSTNLTR